MSANANANEAKKVVNGAGQPVEQKSDAPVTSVEAPKKKVKKLAKEIKGTVVTITEASTNTVLNFDFAGLPQAIKDNFGPFGLSSKLGDAAAGKSGKEAVEAINKVWDGLMKGDWTVRAPAAPKLDKAALTSKLDILSDKERDAAKELLAKLGISL